MQETRVNKVSRRFYIDHADDHAVVRSVPVVLEVALRPQITNQSPSELPASPSSNERGHERRLSKLVHSKVLRPRRKRA